MSTLIPTASSCHTLQLPPIEKDDRCNLNVRTGSASTLYNSLVFTYGGLTIGLELLDPTIPELVKTFQSRLNNSKSDQIESYISGELFYLSLLDGIWTRVAIPKKASKPSPRLYHEICAANNCVYLFGGLKLDTNTKNSTTGDLIPCNDLWEFNLEKKAWTLLHDGTGYEIDSKIPKPRFNHKMTSIQNLSFISKKGHFGILIAGGKDSDSNSIYENVIFDLVDRKYVGDTNTTYLTVRSADGNRIGSTLDSFSRKDSEGHLSINYTNSIIVNVTDEVEHVSKRSNSKDGSGGGVTGGSGSTHTIKEESVIVYAPVDVVDTQGDVNPLLSFKVGKKLKNGKMLPTPRSTAWNNKKHSLGRSKSSVVDNVPPVEAVKPPVRSSQFYPFNLRYPTGGLFGQNIVITGFLPNDFDISIFVFNKPTGKWSRLNIFCDHDYGSHRFWGGFAWQSHHKVVLLGNYVTSKTTSSIRFFSSMITVSLPVTNILASSELAGTSKSMSRMTDREFDGLTDSSVGTAINSPTNRSHTEGEDDTHSSSLDITSESDEEKRPAFEVAGESDGKRSTTISFNEYVHYAAPKTNVTTIRSVFPAAAVTLGRNALDRYGDLISDFELVSSNGDRIPVSLHILTERWGRYFIELLSRGYVQAVDAFEHGKLEDDYPEKRHNFSTTSKDSGMSSFYSGTRTNKLKSSWSTAGGSSYSSHTNSHESGLNKEVSGMGTGQSYHVSIPIPKPNAIEKDAPQFRLPFQEPSLSASSSIKGKSESPPSQPVDAINLETTPGGSLNLPGRVSSAIDPHLSEDPGLPTTATPAMTSIPTIVPPQQTNIRKDSVSSFASANSLLTSHLQDIPPQLPLPDEPIPAVPVTPNFRSTSRKNSTDINSPRASLIHTLTVLRNIPGSKSPRESPFASPRNSISGPVNERDFQSTKLRHTLSHSPTRKGGPMKTSSASNENLENTPTTKPRRTSSSNSLKSMSKLGLSGADGSSTSSGSVSDTKDSEDRKHANASQTPAEMFSEGLLSFEDMKNGNFRMEPSLIPRKLYIPFPTVTVKAFCEFLYTGQIGNKWLLAPTTLDNLALAKFYKTPLLYDLISEVLFGIIGRKEAFVLNESRSLKKRYLELVELTGMKGDSECNFPLDEYEGFVDTVDDGYLDITLLKKTSDINKKSSVASMKRRQKKGSRTLDSTPGTGYTTPTTSVTEDSETNLGLATDEDASDKKTSTSEEDNDFELGYLDKRELQTSNVGPRSKSIFDKSGGDLNFHSTLDVEMEEEKEKLQGLTLDQLVSPNAPVPSDYAIDLIYEMGTFTADMKLMLRSINARQMSRTLNQSREELEATIEVLQKKLDAQNRPKPVVSKSGDSMPATYGADTVPSSNLHPTMSTTSLHTLSSLRTETSEKSTSSNFPRIPTFTPFITSKKGSIGNKGVEKLIAKDVKRDEKLKLKNEKDERMKQIQRSKLEKKQLDKSKRLSSAVFPPISRTQTMDNLPPKKHGLLYNLSHPLARTQSGMSEELKMSGSGGSISETNSIDSSKSSKTPTNKKHYSLFGKKHQKSRDSLNSRESSPVAADMGGSPSIHSHKSTVSVHSNNSKHSDATDGTTKKKFHIFSKNKK
ncbi:negative regulator of sporulation Mds3p [[Candida] anglica]